MVRGTVIVMTSERLLHCPDCAQDQLFSPVDCVDGHGALCPDLACSGCDAAMLIVLAPPPGRPSRRALRNAA